VDASLTPGLLSLQFLMMQLEDLLMDSRVKSGTLSSRGIGGGIGPATVLSFMYSGNQQHPQTTATGTRATDNPVAGFDDRRMAISSNTSRTGTGGFQKGGVETH